MSELTKKSICPVTSHIFSPVVGPHDYTDTLVYMSVLTITDDVANCDFCCVAECEVWMITDKDIPGHTVIKAVS